MIARLTAPGALPAVERAVRRADKRGLVVNIRERGAGFVRADVTCAGTCGMRHLIGGVHDVVLWWDLKVTCDCVARVWCGHAGALIQHEGGVIPAEPEGKPGVPGSDWQCRAPKCGARFETVDAARAHTAMHEVNQFTRTSAVPSQPANGDLAHVPLIPAAGAAPAPNRGSEESTVTGCERPIPLKSWRSRKAAQADIELEHAARRVALGIEDD